LRDHSSSLIHRVLAGPSLLGVGEVHAKTDRDRLGMDWKHRMYLGFQAAVNDIAPADMNR